MKLHLTSLALAGHALAFAPATSTVNRVATVSLFADKAAIEPTETAMFDESFLNEEKLLQASNFAIPPEQLLERAKQVPSPSVGLGAKDSGECLADDFEFCAAVVGPIPRDAHLNSLGDFDLESAFDISANFCGLRVDPLQTNHVWFMNRVKGIHKGPFMGAEATGKEIIHPPQIHHLDFNADGKIKEHGFHTAD